MTGTGASAVTRPARAAAGRLAALACGAVVFFLALLACGFLPARGAALALASQEQPEGVPTDTQGHDPIEEQAGSDQGLADAIDALMDAREGAHAAVLVSRNGETLAQGYYDAVDGSASASTDPDASFAWGHVSDMLVWVAVMQLVEQGSIELADPVSTLLSGAVELPQGYSSISMLNLMNHTTGLDVLPIVNSALPQTGSSSAQSLLRSFDVRGGYGVGELVSYSPYDVVLAAMVVERVSGQDICAYIDEHILDPLGISSTAVVVGGRPSQMRLSQDAYVAQVASGLLSSPDALQASLATSLDRPALACVGPASDALRLVEALVSEEGRAALFERPSTADELFEVTRTYPASGDARVAHGLFALPLTQGTFGSYGSASGFTAAAFVDPETSTCAVVMIAGSSMQDLALAVMRQVFGTDEELGGAAQQADQRDEGTWAGFYRDTSLPSHGAVKTLASLGCTIVWRDSQGGLVIDLRHADSLGGGTYVVEGDASAMPYDFHVSLASGVAFSRVTSDYVQVALSTVVIEVALLAGVVMGTAFSVCYALASIVAVVRSRLLHRRRHIQTSCAVLALLTGLVSLWVAGILLGPGAELALASLATTRAVAIAYCVVACVLLVWVGVTRWRGTCREPRRLLAAALVCASALAVMLNLVYWEILS